MSVTLSSLSHCHNKKVRFKSFKDIKNKRSKEAAIKLGNKIAIAAKEKAINKVVFDRGRYKYHGIIAEFADSARKGGLQF